MVMYASKEDYSLSVRELEVTLHAHIGKRAVRALSVCVVEAGGRWA